MDNGDRWSMYLWGETGSRKTTLAVATLVDFRRQYRYDGRTGFFAPAHTVARLLRNLGNPAAEQQIGFWRDTCFLILDDLGKHRDTPHVIEQVLFLLHHRYDWWEPGDLTIVTANMDLDELGQRIDPATARRLAEGLVLHLEPPT